MGVLRPQGSTKAAYYLKPYRVTLAEYLILISMLTSTQHLFKPRSDSSHLVDKSSTLMKGCLHPG